MLYSVKFKNFFSFKDEAEISFKVNEKAPQTEKYIKDAAGNRLAKVLGVFGHNASGKTNALKSIAFLKYFIIASYTEDLDKEIPILPFEFVVKKQPIEIKAEFSIDNFLYTYFVKLSSKKVLEEKLQKKLFGNKKFKTLFYRVWDDNKKNYEWKDNFKLGVRFKYRLRKNSSVLSTSFRDNHKESVEIVNFWKKVNVNVGVFGKIDDEKYNIIKTAKFFLSHPALKSEAVDLMKKFDIGLTDINIKEEKEEDKVILKLQTIHSNDYKDYKLSFGLASSGTKKLFVILGYALPTLKKGGVVILDEFDTDLHPLMSEAILEMFFSKETNPHNAQLIFSAHSPHLLNLLDKYHIVLTEKNKKGESEIWRLDEMKGVRLDDNYYAKYLAGAYGGVPNLDL